MNTEKTIKIERFLKLLKRYMKKPEDEVIISDISSILEKCVNVRLVVTELSTATENIYQDTKSIYQVIEDLKAKLTVNNVEKNCEKKENNVEKNGEGKENCEHKSKETHITLTEDDSFTTESKSTNSFLRNNFDEKKGRKNGHGLKSGRFNSDNISLSSDDDEGHPTINCQEMMDISDSDVEIINDNVKEGRSNTKRNDVIQIDDSSDEDVQEIKINTNGTFTKKRNQSGESSRKRKRKTSNNSDSRPNQCNLANFPFIIQFPTMQNASFNGTLFVSHNRKFSVKLQGVDPSNFQFNNNYNR